MMGRRNRDGLKLTHIPTGLSAVLWCEWISYPRTRNADHPKVMARAKSWLAAKVHAARNPEPGIKRTYYLATHTGPRIKQAGMLLAEGAGVLDVLHDGTGLDRVMANARRTS